MRFRPTILLVCLAASIACASRPGIQSAELRQIQPGVTTQEEVRGWWGEPDRRSTSPDGSLWVYGHQSGGGLRTATQVADTGSAAAGMFGLELPSLPSVGGGGRQRSTSLAVEFDSEGVVKDYRYDGD